MSRKKRKKIPKYSPPKFSEDSNFNWGCFFIGVAISLYISGMSIHIYGAITNQILIWIAS